jgi:tRNA threonylcarbamoyladenosine biosynthesis protein TsaE
VRLVTGSVDDTRALGEALARAVVRAGDLVVLAGDLGSGKTAFAQGMARAFDIQEPVVSPTFTIVREYEGSLRLVHVDVYRLDYMQELYDLGFEELVDPDRVTLVEWGDVVAAVLPSDRLQVHLDEVETDENQRLITMLPHGPSWHARQRALSAALEPWLAAG